MSVPPKVVSSPSGVAHYYRTAFGSAWTLCGKRAVHPSAGTTDPVRAAYRRGCGW